MGLDDIEVMKIIAALFGMAGAITAPALAFFRYNTTRLEKSQQAMIDEIKDSTTASVQSLQDDVKTMQVNLENRITDFHHVMDTRTTELRDHIDGELRAVKEGQAKADVDIKNLSEALNERDRSLRQKIHDTEKSLLEYKLEANDKFASKH